MDDTPWLHLRPQFTYHGEAQVTGTVAGLTALRDALDQALADGSAEAVVFASDGEGYEITVRRSRALAGLGKPTYLDEEARELARYEREYLVRYSRSERKQAKEALKALTWCRANGDPHLTTSKGSSDE